jgi:Cft2 family RNA processing exonuclease
MAEAGRVKHHIANSIQNSRNTILLAGYCEPNSLGGRLKLRPSNVTIFGEEYQVKAEIAEIKAFLRMLIMKIYRSFCLPGSTVGQTIFCRTWRARSARTF